jgi:hypothetical protein
LISVGSPSLRDAVNQQPEQGLHARGAARRVGGGVAISESDAEKGAAISEITAKFECSTQLNGEIKDWGTIMPENCEVTGPGKTLPPNCTMDEPSNSSQRRFAPKQRSGSSSETKGFSKG